ncbi:hypothetical protein B0I08_101147 [Glaciihabitans tibetensis]|uniref:Uncharacterized protein n=1 Tax=Glaciihabitans tibetensis TaxID=1266600 RepID=A0A2T0VIW2_9MICO|nr:hypothetical protein [Glaciihabitans tibetensis]PRY70025.1 hypothetical protein B0I08_101147 [Glaciihabitans tibetensis]
MRHIRAGMAAVVAALAVLLVVLAPAALASPTTLAAAVAVTIIAAVLVLQAAAVTSGSRSALARSTAFARRQERSAEPAPQHPDTAGRPRTRAPSRGSRA